MKTTGINIVFACMICASACQEAGNKKADASKAKTGNAETAKVKPAGATTDEAVNAEAGSARVISQDDLLHAKGQFCIIKKIHSQGDVVYIDADYIQFFTGDEAVEEAKKRGDKEEVLDEVYIVNDNKMARKLPLANDVEISLLHTENGKPAWVKGNISQLKERISDDDIFILTLQHDAVTQIRQQYLP